MLKIACTIDRLLVDSTRAHAGQITRHGWHAPHPSDVLARRFWTIALGVALEGYAVGRSRAARAGAMREGLAEFAEIRSAKAASAPPRHRVGTSGNPSVKFTCLELCVRPV